MKIVATGDLHGQKPAIPECDLLLIAGDVTPIYESEEIGYQRKWMETEFYPYLAAQPAKKIVWIAGNHDFLCEETDTNSFVEFERRLHDKYRHIYYLNENTIEIDNLRIYGFPYCAHLVDWAFYKEDLEFEKVADKIPAYTDILLTHSPLRGILDKQREGLSVGIPRIEEKVNQVLPKMVISGHIHENNGLARRTGNGGIEVLYRNVSYLDEHYKNTQELHIFEV